MIYPSTMVSWAVRALRRRVQWPDRIEDFPATHQATPLPQPHVRTPITLCAKSAGLRKSPGLRDSSSCRRSFSKGIFLGSGSKSPSDRFAFVSSRKSMQYFFSSRALRYSSSVIDLRIVRGRWNIAIPPSKDSDVKIANRNVVKATFDSALVFSKLVFHRDHPILHPLQRAVHGCAMIFQVLICRGYINGG